jgi:hypothetical protein
VKHFITVTFEVPDYDISRKSEQMSENEAIEKVRKQLEKQPYSWELENYEAENDMGNVIRFPVERIL